jgi:hypothetical protein
MELPQVGLDWEFQIWTSERKDHEVGHERVGPMVQKINQNFLPLPKSHNFLCSASTSDIIQGVRLYIEAEQRSKQLKLSFPGERYKTRYPGTSYHHERYNVSLCRDIVSLRDPRQGIPGHHIPVRYKTRYPGKLC